MLYPLGRRVREGDYGQSSCFQKNSPVSWDMEVHFTPEQEAQLSQVASTVATKAEDLVKNAALRLLDDEVRFRTAVREGIAQADRGEFIEEDEMNIRFEEMLRS